MLPGGELPEWLDLDATTGTFSGTPENADVGTVNIEVVATDSEGETVSDTFAVNVENVNDTPTLENPIQDQTTNEDAEFTFTIPEGTFADVDAEDVFIYSATASDGSELPEWLDLDATTGTFTGTPENADVGTVNIEVVATDSEGETVSDSFALTVENTNDAPTVATEIEDQTATEDEAFTFTIPFEGTFADVDAGDSLTYSLAEGTTLPDWLSFNAENASLSGTPENGDVGTVNIEVVATDSEGETVSDTFAVNVENVNDTPTLENPIQDQTTNEDAEFTFTIPEGTFADVDAGDTFTYSATVENMDVEESLVRTEEMLPGGELPEWLDLDATTGTFSGTPENGDVGTVNIEVVATDSEGATVSDTFALTVENTNDAPTVATEIEDQTTTEDAEFTFTIPEGTFADVDAGDSLTYSLAEGTTLPDWLSFNAESGTFSGTPENADVGTVNIEVVATDSEGATVSDTFAVTVENVNDAPTVDDATFSIEENSEAGTELGIISATDVDDEVLNFVIESGNLDPDNDGNLAFAIDSSTGTITVNDKDDLDFETTSTFNLEVIATDAGNLSDTANITINLNDELPGTFDTEASQNGFFNFSGDSNNLKFTLNNVGSSNSNELGVFVVDDENGSIDGIAPGEDGYLQAALSRAQVIFSTISELPTGFELSDVEKILEIDSDTRLGFYLIPDGTTQSAVAQLESTGTTDLPVFFSNSSNLQVSELSENGFNLNWADAEGSSDFTAIELGVELTEETPAPIANLQREAQLELLDLRDITGTVDVQVEVHREAAFDNLIGFYQITDINGGIDTNGDGVADVNVGDQGYKEAALTNRVTGLDLLATDDGQTTTFDGTFDGGSILASFIVVDGTIEQALSDSAETYFSYLGANSDGLDHIRMLGENTFGYEDLPGSTSDNDFNDVIVEIQFPNA